MDEKQPLLVPGPSLNSSYEIEEVSPDETEKPLDYSKLLNKSKFWKLKMFTILWISVFLFCVPLITIISKEINFKFNFYCKYFKIFFLYLFLICWEIKKKKYQKQLK